MGFRANLQERVLGFFPLRAGDFQRACVQVPLPKRANLPSPMVLTQAFGECDRHGALHLHPF